MSPKPLFINIVLIGWAAFWSFFVVASEVTQADSPLQKLLICTFGIAFFVGSAALTMRRPRIGGPCLLLMGVVLLFLSLLALNNTLEVKIFLMATLALPPLLIGRHLLDDASVNRTV